MTTASSWNELQHAHPHRKTHIVKLKLFIDLNNVRDEFALQSSLFFLYYARAMYRYLEEVGVHFLEGREYFRKFISWHQSKDEIRDIW